MDELSRKAAALRELANTVATGEARSLVAAALHDKFEGVQAVALDVLGAWGDPASVAALREFLKAAFTRKFGWAIRGVAVRNLISHVTASDVDWVLDLYFTRPDALTKHELVRLVITLPPEPARARLVAELRSPDRLNRQAAVKAIGNMPYPDRRQLLWPLREDADAFVSKSARLLSEGAA